MSNPLYGCGCGNQSTQEVCGDFEEPTVPDIGRCHPYREKRGCGAPELPANVCNDTEAYAEYDPDRTPPFVIISTLFDEDCDPILDENGARIMA